MDIKKQIKSFPDSPGVYLMKDNKGKVIYVGKAASLKKRVASYFRKSQSDLKNKILVEQISDVEIITTISEHEAFLLESRLIKRFKPRYNISFKDDKSFPFIKITKQEYPRILIGRRKPKERVEYFGPYTNSKALRNSLKSLRKIFPFRSCRQFPKNACLDYHIGLCCGPCIDKVSKTEYRKVISDFKHFLKKGSKSLARNLEQRMLLCSKQKKFEEAIQLRDRIEALGVLAQQSKAGIFDFLGLAKEPYRIEAFDISNLYGNESVGSMVTFIGGKPSKNNYRRFKIRDVQGIDDYRMIEEVMSRRYNKVVRDHLEKPDLIIIDGGRGHLGVALRTIKRLRLNIPIIAIAKEQELIYTNKNTKPIALSRQNRDLQLIQRIRDEAHRFAIKYHHLLRSKKISV